jgi:hypothetical protein
MTTAGVRFEMRREIGAAHKCKISEVQDGKAAPTSCSHGSLAHAAQTHKVPQRIDARWIDTPGLTAKDWRCHSLSDRHLIDR